MSLEYIAKHMDMVNELDEEGYLPLEQILICSQIISLNTNIHEVIEVILTIPSLTLSEDQHHVRLNLPLERKTLIIRDTPEDLSEDTIRSFVSNSPITIRKELGNICFVTFESEAIAMESLKELQGQQLKVRVKSEFYKKELLHRLAPYQPEERPQRKLSSAATPFTPTSSLWGVFGLNGVESSVKSFSHV